MNSVVKKDTDSSVDLQLESGPDFQPFPELTWLRGGISQRSDGGMSWDSFPENEVAARRHAYFSKFGINIRSCVAADQVHRTHVHCATASDNSRGMTTRADRISGTDGFVTDEKNLTLTTLHADCAPVYFANTSTRRIGLAHCGWRGTLAGLPGRMLRDFMSKDSQDLKFVVTSIGPTISIANYEFGVAEADLFVKKFGANVVTGRGGKFYLDLVAAITVDLLRNGLNPSTIPQRPPCTYADQRYASYRRDGTPTRSMLAWLVRTN